jgi:hypothetical protein
MVYYFHTIYARDDLKYLISIRSDYKQYNGEKVRETDTLIIAVYLHLTALAEFINLMAIYTKDNKQYRSCYKARFGFIDSNIDADHKTKSYIYHPIIKRLLERKNSKILLYNSWETRDLYRCCPVILHYCQYKNIPPHKLLLSMTDHQHMFNRYPSPRIISYDWQYIHAKKNFSRDEIVSRDLPKPKHLICFNSRCNDERLAAVAYLYSNHREKCHLSLINNSRSDPISDSMLHLVKNFVLIDQFNAFKQRIPLSLDESAKSLPTYIEEAYIMVMFETNIVRFGCQQVSEKTYKPILAGIPFILWGHQGGILAHLRNLGFKTFSPFIDETYDDKNICYTERYMRLINELNRICSLGATEIETLYKQCIPMVKHNFTILESGAHIPPLL